MTRFGDRTFFLRMRIKSKLRRVWCVVSGGHRHSIVVPSCYYADRNPPMSPQWFWPDGTLMRDSEPVPTINGHLCERCRCHLVRARFSHD